MTLPTPPSDPLVVAFYQRYPTLTPFVGERFSDHRKPSVLLVGESHYLPNASTVHLDSKSWYAGSTETPSSLERSWMNTADGVAYACRERFKNKAHSIWRESLRTLNAHGPRHADFVDAAKDIAFYNFFLRPARQGRSLEVTPDDEDLANRAFEHWLLQLAPTAVIFLSALAHRSLRVRSSEALVAVVPHPASPWWNRPSPKYGGKTGRARFAEIVEALPWPR